MRGTADYGATLLARAALILCATGVLSACWSRAERQDPGEAACQSIEERSLAAPEAKVPRQRVARGAAFEILFPGDEAQYEALNKMALIGVWVFSSVEGALPIRDAYVMEQKSAGGAMITVLPAVSPERLKRVRSHEESSEVARRFGAFSQEVFFFIPIRMLGSKLEFGVRFRQGEDHLPVARFPVNFDLPFFRADAFPYEDPDKAPDLPLATALVEKYYCHR